MRKSFQKCPWKHTKFAHSWPCCLSRKSLSCCSSRLVHLNIHSCRRQKRTHLFIYVMYCSFIKLHNKHKSRIVNWKVNELIVWVKQDKTMVDWNWQKMVKRFFFDEKVSDKNIDFNIIKGSKANYPIFWNSFIDNFAFVKQFVETELVFWKLWQNISITFSESLHDFSVTNTN